MQHRRPHLYLILILALLSSCVSQRNASQGPGSHASHPTTTSRRSTEQRLKEAVEGWLHVPYAYGGISKKGVDCSGLTMQLYREVYGIELIHNSRKQLEANCQQEVAKSRLRMGDLVFFVTTGKRASKANISHVGLYLSDGRFVHATTRRGVTINSLDEPYYRKAWVTGGRVTRRP